MRIVCVSDLHENLIDIPDCDLLLIAGDLSYAFSGDLPAKQRFLSGPFRKWLERIAAKEVVLVAGNHDRSIQKWGFPEGLPCHYLEDEGVELFGLKIWGTPWQPWFHGWAFNAPERHGEEFLAEKFAAIPDDTDIVICHGPPRGYGDKAGPHGEHVGSTAMTDRLEQVKPWLMVCGHVHYGYGQYELGDTRVVNAAVVNGKYKPVNAPVVFDVDPAIRRAA